MIDDLHESIAQTAAIEANADPAVVQVLAQHGMFGELVFTHRVGTGIRVDISKDVMRRIPDDQHDETRQILRAAVKRAVHRIITTDPEAQRAFVGAIVGMAREGHNYFDRYETDS